MASNMKNAQIQTRPWDAAKYLKDEKDISLYIEAAMDEAPNDKKFIARVLGDISRARDALKSE